ncbi:MAG TPA: sulfatase [Candidatus Binatia bacterium]
MKTAWVKNSVNFLVAAVLSMVSVSDSSASPTRAATPHPEVHEKPNFIVILTDDLDAKSIELMPNLNALLTKQGAAFSNYFVTSSLCCPSRASLLRGQYPHNHQVLTNAKPEGGFERFHALGEEQSTMATWLQAAGYRTALLGKYLNEYPGKQSLYVPPGWDEWYALMDHRAAFFDYRLNENGHAVSYGHDANAYETDVLAAKTVDFIARTVASGKQPFFIYLAPSAPHLPATPAPRHEKDFLNATAPRTPAFNESDLSGKPAWVRERPPLSVAEIAEIDRVYRRRLQSMLAVDEMIKKIVAALQTHGLLNQTYIFFTSDNGFHLGEHRLTVGKDTAYEEDIHVPLIVRGPGIPAGRTLQHLTLNIDLAPTLAELAGVSAPNFVDGRSLGPLLKASPAPHGWREDFLVEYWPQSRPTRKSPRYPAYQALRTKGYLYVEHATGEEELYDLRVDPHELHNIAAAAPNLVARLSKRLGLLEHCAGANCRQESPDDYLEKRSCCHASR